MRKNLIFALVAGVLFAPLLAAQQPRGSEIQVDKFPALNRYGTQVAMAPNGDFIVVWATGGSQFQREPARLWFRLFRADGTPRTKQLRVGNTRFAELKPHLAVAADGSFLVVWESGSDADTSVFGRRFGADGTPHGDRFLLSSSTVGSQDQPTATFARDGSFVAAWVSRGPSFPDEVVGRRFDAAGQPLGPDFVVNTESAEQDAPQVALSASGDFLIGWLSYLGEAAFFDVMGRRFARDGTPQGDEIRLNDQDTAPGSQYEFALGMLEDGAFVVLWTDSADAAGAGRLRGQRFTAGAERVGVPFLITAPPGGYQSQPALALAADGSFFAAWMDSFQPNLWRIFGRRFASDGTPRSDEMRIDLPPPGLKIDPSVALGHDGRGVVAWTRYDGNKLGVFVRRLVP
ncbi:MAG TPA: hypothetical protein VLX28_17840 [Thermoanaerobaculia bacterium]|nr:hypothetical protein [Thermoanaerobaculia bacterium]